jgi:hypothetical protein
MTVVATSYYAYVDGQTSIRKLRGDEVNDRGTWSVAAIYAVNDVVEFGGALYYCLSAVSGTQPSGNSSAYWSTLVLLTDEQVDLTLEELYLLILSTETLASEAYTLATYGTTVAVQAYQVGTTALETAWAGTSLAYTALTTAWAGTSQGTVGLETVTQLAYTALTTAWTGTSLANTALTTAWTGTSLAYTALETAWAGTSQGTVGLETVTQLANTALETAWAGTSLANTALETAWAGTSLANTALETAWTGTSQQLAYTALTTAWTGTSLAYTALTTAWAGTSQGTVALEAVTQLAYTALETAWTGTEAASLCVLRSGDTMTGTLVTPNVFYTHGTAVNSGTVTVDFNGEAFKTVAMTAATTFDGTNYAAGHSVTYRCLVSTAGTDATIPVAFNAAFSVLSTVPTSFPVNKLSVMSFTSFGSLANDVIIAYATQS